MNRICTWTAVAALAVGGAAAVGGCRADDAQSNLPAGENGSRGGGNGAFGSDVNQPGEGTHNMDGTGANTAGKGTNAATDQNSGGTMPMNGMH